VPPIAGGAGDRMLFSIECHNPVTIFADAMFVLLLGPRPGVGRKIRAVLRRMDRQLLDQSLWQAIARITTQSPCFRLRGPRDACSAASRWVLDRTAYHRGHLATTNRRWQPLLSIRLVAGFFCPAMNPELRPNLVASPPPTLKILSRADRHLSLIKLPYLGRFSRMRRPVLRRRNPVLGHRSWVVEAASGLRSRVSGPLYGSIVLSLVWPRA